MPVRERFLPRPGARLQEQFREVARFRHLSLRTEEAYWDWIRRFILFHRRKGAVGSEAGVVALAGEGGGMDLAASAGDGWDGGAGVFDAFGG